MDELFEEDLRIDEVFAAQRSFPIPKAVQEEAQRGIAWRAKFKRGGTDVGLNTARLLAKGGNASLVKIRHISRYFPRHEVDKRAEGWRPGEKGYPSAGRIAWSLWGGEAGKRWATAIVKRARAYSTLATSDFVIIDKLGRKWDPRLHPRGRDGKFIETGGILRLFMGKGDSQVRAIVQVQKINDDGTFDVKVKSSREKSDIGKTLRVRGDMVSQVRKTDIFIDRSWDPDMSWMTGDDDGIVERQTKGQDWLPDRDGNKIHKGTRVHMGEMGDGTVVAVNSNDGTVDIKRDKDGKTYRARAEILDDIDVDREAQDMPEGGEVTLTPGNEDEDIPEGMRRATPEEIARLKIAAGYRNPLVPVRENEDLLWMARDSQGRRKRTYSSEHDLRQAARKFERIKKLHAKYDDIEARLIQDARKSDDALVAALIFSAAFRPGSERDTKAKTKAYGATTLLGRHVSLAGATGIDFDFIGKEGVHQRHRVSRSGQGPNAFPEDVIVSEIAKRIKSGIGPNDKLFDTDEKRVNDYISSITDGIGTAKDFRTLMATSLARDLASGQEPPESKREYVAMRNDIGEEVAEYLGNKRAQALKSYIDPTVFDRWADEGGWTPPDKATTVGVTDLDDRADVSDIGEPYDLEDVTPKPDRKASSSVDIDASDAMNYWREQTDFRGDHETTSSDFDLTDLNLVAAQQVAAKMHSTSTDALVSATEDLLGDRVDNWHRAFRLDSPTDDVLSTEVTLSEIRNLDDKNLSLVRFGSRLLVVPDYSGDPDSISFIARTGSDKDKRRVTSAPLGTDEADALIRENAVGRLLSQWVSTSNDGNAASLAVQQVTANEFGMDSAASWDIDDTLQSRIDSLIDTHDETLRSYVRGMYDATQEMFRAQGVTSVAMYRGMIVKQDDLEKAFENPEDIINMKNAPKNDRVRVNATAITRPLSSWAAIPSVSIGFTERRQERGSIALVIREETPVESIIGSPVTGLGAGPEYEYVALGGNRQVTVIRAETMKRVAQDSFRSGLSGKERQRHLDQVFDDANLLNPGCGSSEFASATACPVVLPDYDEANSDWSKSAPSTGTEPITPKPELPPLNKRADGSPWMPYSPSMPTLDGALADELQDENGRVPLEKILEKFDDPDFEYVGFDFETTGLATSQAIADAEGSDSVDRPWQIAMITYRGGQEVDRKVLRMDPGKNSHPMALKTTGMTDDEIRSVNETWADQLLPMLDVFSGRAAMAQNAGFDLGIMRDMIDTVLDPDRVDEIPEGTSIDPGKLRQGLADRGITSGQDWLPDGGVLDTKALAVAVHTRRRKQGDDTVPVNNKLVTMAEFYGAEHWKAHDAESDVEAMHAILRPMIQNGMSWDQQKPVDLNYERNREAKDKELWPAKLEQYKQAREEWEASQPQSEPAEDEEAV